jgi:hypothetical protein
MDVLVQEPVHVQVTVPRVLPDVHHYHCHGELPRQAQALVGGNGGCGRRAAFPLSGTK